jgi:hypothetical protein
MLKTVISGTPTEILTMIFRYHILTSELTDSELDYYYQQICTADLD